MLINSWIWNFRHFSPEWRPFRLLICKTSLLNERIDCVTCQNFKIHVIVVTWWLNQNKEKTHWQLRLHRMANNCEILYAWISTRKYSQRLNKITKYVIKRVLNFVNYHIIWQINASASLTTYKLLDKVNNTPRPSHKSPGNCPSPRTMWCRTA